MPDKTFDPTKPVQTRAGLPARIVCTDYKGYQKNTPILALVQTAPGLESTQVYKEDGTCSVPSVDLVNIPEVTHSYTNMFYKEGFGFSKGGTHADKQKALDAKKTLKSYAFTIEHTFEDGKLISSEVIR